MIEVALIIAVGLVALTLLIGYAGQRPTNRRTWTTHRIAHEEMRDLWHKHD